MKLNLKTYYLIRFFALLVIVAGASTSLAAKGGNGNGGGKPGGNEDPPTSTPPIMYSVTTAALPGYSSVFYDHNESAAMVGSLYDAPIGDRRALAYLPEVSSNVFILDELPGLLGKPSWHTRSAVDINNNGTIVGNLHPDGDPDTMRSYVVTGATTSSPALHELPLVDPSAQQEAAVAINDDGDVVVWSQKTAADGVTSDSLYVGNPGLDGNTVSPWIYVDFSSQNLAGLSIANANVSITPRDQNGVATVVGAIRGSIGGDIPFRVHSDGTAFEAGIAQTTAEGDEVFWYGAGSQLDVNAMGDVVGQGRIQPLKGRNPKPNSFSALWAEGSSDYVSAIGEDRYQTDYGIAVTNDDRDFLLEGPDDGYLESLWHSGWSPENGAVPIVDLVDPADPFLEYLRSNVSFEEITNQGESGWPTIVGRRQVDGEATAYWFVLTPQLTATALATSAVPEPATGACLATAVLTVVGLCRRGRL